METLVKTQWMDNKNDGEANTEPKQEHRPFSTADTHWHRDAG